MKNLALVIDGIVENVIVANDDFLADNYIEYTESNPAYIGGDYVDGYFYTLQPYASWTRLLGNWVPPIPYPNNGLTYNWDEENQDWEVFNVSA